MFGLWFPESAFRGKRQVPDHRKNTCALLLVADHRFFRHMGRSEESTTLNYLVRTQNRRWLSFRSSAVQLTSLTLFSDRADRPRGRHLQKHVLGRRLHRLRRPDPTGEEQHRLRLNF